MQDEAQAPDKTRQQKRQKTWLATRQEVCPVGTPSRLALKVVVVVVLLASHDVGAGEHLQGFVRSTVLL